MLGWLVIEICPMIANVGYMAKFSTDLALRFGLVWGGLSGRCKIRWREGAWGLAKETELGWWISVLVRKFTMSRVWGIRFERFFNQVGLKRAQLVIWVLWVQPEQVKKMICVWKKLTYGIKGVAEMLQFFNIFHNSHSPFPQILYLNTNLSQTSPGRSRVDLVESIPNLQSSWIAQQFEIASLQSERHKSSS